MLVSLLLVLISQVYAASILFQPEIRWNEPHTISFVHSSAQKNWGKNDEVNLILSCDKKHELKTLWLNSKTIKSVITPALVPAENCAVTYQGKIYNFSAPKIQILEIGPWSISNRMNENDPIYIKTDFPLDRTRFLKEISVQVEGLDEKIEFDIVDDKVAAALSKEYANFTDASVLWLIPRRALATDKKLKIEIAKGQSNGMIKDGHTRAEFKLEISCSRTKAEEPCIPLGNLDIRFDTDVEKKFRDQIYYTYEGKKYYPVVSKDENSGYVTFKSPLPASSTLEINIPKDLKDATGRSAVNADKFPFKIEIGEFPPLAKLPGAFGILESTDETALPISIRNMDQPISLQLNSANLKEAAVSDIFKWFHQIEERQHQWGKVDMRTKSFFAANKIKTQNQKLITTVSNKEIEVLGLPLPKKGLYVVEIASPKLGEKLLETPGYFFVSSMVLVTNISLQLKAGQQNVLVWATSLDKGEPLAKVNIELYNCDGKKLVDGITNKDGVVKFKLEKSSYINCSNKDDRQYGTLMARATLNDDMSFTLSKWDEGIESWRFQLPYHQDAQAVRYLTVFDRPIYQQKDKISFLIMARDQVEKGLIIPKGNFSDKIMITHSGSEKSWNDKISWTDLGTAPGSFTLPEDAPLGHYSISLVNKNDKDVVTNSEYVGSFEVEAFKIPLTKLKLQWKDNQNVFVAKEANSLFGTLQYLSGGIASGVDINVRGEVSKGYEDAEKFRWSNGDVSQYNENDNKYKIDKKSFITDKDGSFKYTPEGFQKKNYIQQANFEVEYMDPNGKFQSHYTYATVYPGQNIVGIKSFEDSTLNKPQVITMKVRNTKGQAVSGAKVSLEYFKRNYQSVRKKIIGGFYSYDSFYENIRIDDICSGKTNDKGILTCQIQLKEAGEYIFQAKTRDDDGNETACYVSESFYSNESWTPLQAHDRADLIPEKTEYNPGEIAKLEFKIPFEKAWVLVTKERSGIVDYSLVNFERKNPFLSVPLDSKDVPNIYVSAVAVRGREQAAQVTGTIDLGRPALRMGLTHLKVNLKKELKVAVIPSKTVYQVRDAVNVKLKVDLQKLNHTKVKVVLAVFDEGLLQINPNTSFSLASAFLRMWGHEVATSSAYVQVIGKRHFGLKAKPHGGGGGQQLSRELFDTLLYWNPAIALNEKGEAEINFKLNDSLTGFKIMALAYSEEYFGVAEATIKSTQDVLSFSGLSTLLRTDDQTLARYQLKNTTSKNLNLIAYYKNSIGGKNELKVNLAAEEGKTIDFGFTAPHDAGLLEHTLLIKDGEKTIDVMKNKQTIIPLIKPVITQADLIAVNKTATLPGAKASVDLAGMKIDFASTVLGSNEGVKAYMQNYLFNCLEQRLAKAIVLNDKKLKEQIVRDLPTYISSEGLLRFYPMDSLEASSFLTAHFLETSFWNKWELPKNIVDSLEAGLVLVAEGKISFKYMTAADIELAKLKAIAILKLRASPLFQVKWLSLISSDLATDSLETLEYKWMIWGLSNNLAESSAALDMIRNRMTIKASAMELNPRPEDFAGYYMTSPTVLYSRFLLLQSLIPTDKAFQEFYKESKVKFLKGFSLHKKYGNYGNTTNNTMASLVHQRVAPVKKVDGKTLVNETALSWDITDPSITLDAKAQAQPLVFKHLGSGAVYPTISYMHWPNPKENLKQGFSITAPELNREFKLGERVDLIWKIKADYNSRPVAMQIPISPGSSVLNISVKGNGNLIYQERDFTEVRLYFDDMNQGDHEITLSTRFDQPGTYQVPGLLVEEMYSPDRRGQAAYATWIVR